MATTNFIHQINGLEVALLEFARQLTKKEENAQQLYNKTIERALNKQHKFRESTNLKSWLFTIMRNICASGYCKEAKTRRLRNLNESEQRDEAGRAPNSTNFASIMNDLQVFIDGLDEHIKIPYTLHYYGHKHQEIANELNLPLTTVQRRISLAQQELKTMRSKKI